MKVSVHKLQRLPSLKRAGNSLRRLKWPSFVCKLLSLGLVVSDSLLQKHTQGTYLPPNLEPCQCHLTSKHTNLIEPIWVCPSHHRPSHPLKVWLALLMLRLRAASESPTARALLAASENGWTEWKDDEWHKLHKFVPIPPKLIRSFYLLFISLRCLC